MKNSKFAIIVLAVVALVVVVVYLILTALPPAAISPTNFQGFVVNGGPKEGIYAVAFSLMDDDLRNGPAQGTLVFEIFDSRGTVLYTTAKQLTISDYSQNDVIIAGSKVIGYSWTIPAAAVSRGLPS